MRRTNRPKNTTTNSEKPACNDGIAATTLLQSRATPQSWTNPVNPNSTTPRRTCRSRRSPTPQPNLGSLAIHGGTVGSTTNSTQAASTTDANRRMKRTQVVCPIVQAAEMAITGTTKCE